MKYKFRAASGIDVKDYLKSLVRVLLELAVFALGVVILTVFIQSVGQRMGISVLIVVLIVIILILAAIRK